MSDRPARLVLDTNVWIDNYCGWHAGFPACKELLLKASLEGVELYFPVHAAADVLYMVATEYKRKTKELEGDLTESMAIAAREVALESMRNMVELATPIGADGSDLWLADRYLSIHKDFEDNLVLAACRRIKADYLVTNDRQLIQKATILAKTPAQMVELMKLGKLPTFDGLSPDEISWQFRA